MLRKYLQKVLLISTACCFLSFTVRAEEGVLEDVKSVYIYNFLSFIEWPLSLVQPKDRYLLCVSATESFVNKLNRAVTNEKVNGLPIQVMPLDNLKTANQCHLLYLQDESKFSVETLLGLQKNGTLIVGESASFLSSDAGMIGFESRGMKVRVAINLTHMLNAGFKVSSNY